MWEHGVRALGMRRAPGRDFAVPAHSAWGWGLQLLCNTAPFHNFSAGLAARPPAAQEVRLRLRAGQ